MLGEEESISIPALISKKKQLLSSSMKRTSEWISSQDIPSDLTIQVEGATFNLHKFPLITKCGYVQKLISKSNPKIKQIELNGIPGGKEAFELAVKFCYGLDFDITTENVAMLRCVSEFLEMTEDYAADNLISRAELYLQEVALTQLSSTITVLHKSEMLLPTSEKVKLISRCIDAIAYMTTNDPKLSPSLSGHLTGLNPNPKPVMDWWAEELTVLRIDIFQRVLAAMKARVFRDFAFGPLVMLYAQKSLRSLDIYKRGKAKPSPNQQHEKRIILESIVSLLPREKNSISVSFLSMLLRSSIYLDTTLACRLDLEKRMGTQLGQAVLDDLMIPVFEEGGSGVRFDVETVERVLVNYIEEEGSNGLDYGMEDDMVSLPPNDAAQVGRLMESYLAEIATDPNLSIEKFVNLAELIPEQARFNEDGMYRAIDIYLKAHPSLGEAERKRICQLMDCQKLSREACAHAAQNDRLPAQTVVQVLHSEQQRLRDTSMYGASFMGAESPSISYKATSLASGTRYQTQSSDEVSRLQQENEELKMELLKMKMKLKDNPVPNTSKKEAPLSGNFVPSAGKPPLPKKSFISSVSKTLGKINPFLRMDGIGSSKARTKPPKDRRHSIS
ncbi:hypothetical protein LUZ60_005933 [Juncus effusus]|nr:hypothetical protein LUZ60_005933 [Juncus effusus]